MRTSPFHRWILKSISRENLNGWLGMAGEKTDLASQAVASSSCVAQTGLDLTDDKEDSMHSVLCPGSGTILVSLTALFTDFFPLLWVLCCPKSYFTLTILSRTTPNLCYKIQGLVLLCLSQLEGAGVIHPLPEKLITSHGHRMRPS